MDLTLPLDHAAIERILPHRYPFLLVDRITELEVDKRIVGIKNVSLNERYLSHAPNGSAVLPPTILTEAIGQDGHRRDDDVCFRTSNTEPALTSRDVHAAQRAVGFT